MHPIKPLFFLLLFLPEIAFAQEASPTLLLENESISLTLQSLGGAISACSHKERPVNPLSWALTPEQMPANNRAGAAFRGHFLCLGRWGSPTAGEIAAGVPHNGDHNNRLWRVATKEKNHLRMVVDASADQFHIERDIRLEPQAPVFHVVERVYHTGTVGRLSNIVQHPTLGPPFLDADTRINSNAGPGFLQRMSYPDPASYAYRWPAGIRDSARRPLDLRRSDGEVNYVSTHVFDDSVQYGWITAYSPKHQLVYGFIWKTADYPWLNVWHYTQEGQPVAKGLEFGTAGIGRSYQELLSVDCRFYGYPSWEYHDAGEMKEKRYSCFLLPVNAGWEEVAAVSVSGTSIRIQGGDGTVYDLPFTPQPQSE